MAGPIKSVIHVHFSNRQLGRSDVLTLGLSALGGALEFYDFVIFVFFTTLISQLFFPPDIPEWLRQAQTFGIFAAGYLARPVGGIVMAHFGDLLGRKKMFALSIFLMSVPTLCIGLLPTYASIGLAAPLLLLCLRILQGAAIGGEVPGAWVFVAEHVPDRHTGLACGILTSGLCAGILMGSLVASGLNRYFSPSEMLDFGWRIAFIIGGAFGLLSVWLRQWLRETPVFMEMQATQTLASELPLKAVLRQHTQAIIESMLFSWLLAASVVTMILMTPTLIQRLYSISPADALAANSIATLALTIGCIASGWIVDRFGAGLFFTFGSPLLGVCSWMLYAQLKVDPSHLIGWYALAGLSVGVIGAVPFVMIKAFPPPVRFSGLSFSYNMAYAIFGGLTPVIVSLWLPSNPMAPALYVAGVSMIGFLLGVRHYLRH
jgi:MFS family permease